MAKCPTCGKALGTLTGQKIKTHVTLGHVLNSVVYTCPHVGCQAILSVGPDPLALKADIVSELFERLKKGK
jgi:hypothetical protein